LNFIIFLNLLYVTSLSNTPIIVRILHINLLNFSLLVALLRRFPSSILNL